MKSIGVRRRPQVTADVRGMSHRGAGEGSIFQRRDGRWVAVLQLGYANGKRQRKTLYARTRGEVQKQLQAHLRRALAGSRPVDDRITVGEYLERWLDSARATVRIRTWTRYEQYVRIHAAPIAHLRLAAVGPADLQQLLTSRIDAGASPSTVGHLRAVLHRALRQAELWGLVMRNPVSLTRAPRVARKDMRTLSVGEAQAFLAAVRDDRLEALYVVALTTGLRQGELLGLRWSDLHAATGALQVQRSLERSADGAPPVLTEPKTRSARRLVPLPQLALDALRRHKARQAEERLRAGPAWADRELMFTTEIGGPIDASNLVKRSFRPALKRAGIAQPFRFHDLRHTAATLLLARSVHPKVVSGLLGHSQISVTLDVYSHVTPGLQRAAAEVFDDLLAITEGRPGTT